MQGIKCNQREFNSVMLMLSNLYYNNTYVCVKEMVIITATRVDPVTLAADQQVKHAIQKKCKEM